MQQSQNTVEFGSETAAEGQYLCKRYPHPGNPSVGKCLIFMLIFELQSAGQQRPETTFTLCMALFEVVWHYRVRTTNFVVKRFPRLCGALAPHSLGKRFWSPAITLQNIYDGCLNDAFRTVNDSSSACFLRHVSCMSRAN